MKNLDSKTVEGFGEEWGAFDQSQLSIAEQELLFDRYFQVFRWDLIDQTSVGFDLGCGSGRWDRLLAPHVGHLHCIDASALALDVARQNLRGVSNVSFHNFSVGEPVFPSRSMDFGISLGVLHHVPDTQLAIRYCVEMLKIGGTILLYLYYRFDNRPVWFRYLWAAADVSRTIIARLPFRLRLAATSVIAAAIYLPFARLAAILEHFRFRILNFPLASYRHLSFYTMRTDALDRFGTRLEHRFTRGEIQEMLEQSGCGDIRFSPAEPYWCVSAVRVA